MTSTTDKTELLTRMMRPRGVAIIGASENLYSLGTRYLGGMVRHEYPGGLYPVNPKYDEVMGLKCYPSILDVPDPCDTAVLSVREELVEKTLTECAEKGLAGVVVFAAGYREAGEEGAEKERRLAALAKELGIRFVGPNSPGFINFVDRAPVTATSVQFREVLAEAGRLGVVAQSGGVAGIIAERAMDRGIGLSYMLCSGNEADFATPEAIEYLVDDDHTDAIAVYAEGVNDAEGLAKAWQKASDAGKPVVMYRPGSSKASVRAAAAHTGSLADDDQVFDGFAKQYGVIRAYDLDEMLEIATALPKLPERDYENILILTTSGGGSVLAADAIGRLGMDLPELDQEIQESLAERFGSYAVFHNPVDMTSDFVANPALFKQSIELTCASADHDVVVLILTVQRPDFAKELSDMILDTPEAHEGKLIVMWYAGEMSDEARFYLRSEGVTVLEHPRTLAAALDAGRVWYSRRKDLPVAASPEPKQVPEPANAGELFATLAGHGVPVAPNQLIAEAGDLEAASESVPAPWVLKTASTTLGRKSDSGAVRLGLTELGELEESYEAIRAALAGTEAADEPLLLQSMVPIGFELLASVSCDRQYGPAVVLGVGGRMVELHRRASVRRPPLEASDAKAVLGEVGLEPLLEGFRDIPALDPADLAALGNALAAAAEELLAPGDILECNPVAIRSDGGGLCAVDARIERGSE
ncbi:MAG TPA: acetate--CoA ligase family protein [Solirubrobacterales bacterium]|jgi:acetyltransferase